MYSGLIAKKNPGSFQQATQAIDHKINNMQTNDTTYNLEAKEKKNVKAYVILTIKKSKLT